MNVQLLNRIMAAIDEEPLRLEMGAWALTQKLRANSDWLNYEPLGVPPCGTAACIYGWGVLLDVPPEQRILALDRVQEEGDTVRAASMFHVAHDAATRLTILGYWPERFQTPYRVARINGDARLAANVAIERIKFFIETDGTDGEEAEEVERDE